MLPGSGFSTVMGKVPAMAAVPVAVSCVEETKVVEVGELLRRTCAPETKLAASDGEREDCRDWWRRERCR